MGQKQSMEQGYFITALQALMKEKGIKVSQSALREFFDIVRDYCPWFPDGGTIDLKDWQRVGQELKNQMKIRGAAVPGTLWSTWTCIKEVLDPQDSIEIVSLSSEAAQPLVTSDAPVPPETTFNALSGQSWVPSPLPPLPLLEQLSVQDPENNDYFPFGDQGDDGPYLEDQRKPAFLAPLVQKVPLKRPSFQAQDRGLPRMAFPITQNQQSTEPYPIMGATPLQRTLYQATQYGEDTSAFHTYPVIQQGGQRVYSALSFKLLKDLKSSAAQYGPTAPFTLSMLDNLSREALCPGDWKVIAQACLSVGDNLLWKAEFAENAEKQAMYNKRTNIPVDFNMLTGTGQYYDVGLQLNYPEIAYNQINTCAITAWKKLPSTGGRTEELSKIRQGPDEKYQDFVGRLLTAVSRIVTDGEAGTIIVKQLAYENANSACQAAIRPWKNQGTLEDYIRLCAEIGPSYIQGITLAAALKGIDPLQVHAQLQGKNVRTNPRKLGGIVCFKCGQKGHMKAQCHSTKIIPTTPGLPSGPNINNKPAIICPRCRRGYHWVNECRSKTDCNGKPLQGNWERGQPQAPQTMAAMFPQAPSHPLCPTLETSQVLANYTAAPPPVQD
ncbi:endogenous retrovirus group K member 10 Gag polyprotein isoform X3 [Neofelis nebulosa]|uniref:endogenous retrovirus group K member 10 Gag polyprotein isoform X3 n=1 Tax=Neofelis nebulosa TaxID=61452 RepID=UPI0027298517|nr:endogenous retrovirus group K member 10 Gag polyprotein isoform X3 [Neofelis nebulosa]XP_058572645.1 endogenous retrovirus group K member 10 Gag polyprotein isoform X3 [Neofelis nebulosa]